jgi:hypothetical protein
VRRHRSGMPLPGVWHHCFHICVSPPPPLHHHHHHHHHYHPYHHQLTRNYAGSDPSEQLPDRPNLSPRKVSRIVYVSCRISHLSSIVPRIGNLESPASGYRDIKSTRAHSAPPKQPCGLL